LFLPTKFALMCDADGHVFGLQSRHLPERPTTLTTNTKATNGARTGDQTSADSCALQNELLGQLARDTPIYLATHRLTMFPPWRCPIDRQERLKCIDFGDSE
jgi:hypothetical protein